MLRDNRAALVEVAQGAQTTQGLTEARLPPILGEVPVVEVQEQAEVWELQPHLLMVQTAVTAVPEQDTDSVVQQVMVATLHLIQERAVAEDLVLLPLVQVAMVPQGLILIQHMVQEVAEVAADRVPPQEQRVVQEPFMAAAAALEAVLVVQAMALAALVRRGLL